MTVEEFIKSTDGQSYTKRALGWFQHNLGKVVTSQELAIIPGKNGKQISHNMRRIFELRDEKGYDIINHKDERGIAQGLRVDEWVLVSNDPDEKKIRNRGVTKPIMIKVFARDNYQCKTCGRTPEDDDPFKEGVKIKLHVGHIDPHKSDEERDNSKKLTEDDFVTMCNVCNEGLKNEELKIVTLLDRVKDATVEEKQEILKYLSEDLG